MTTANATTDTTARPVAESTDQDFKAALDAYERGYRLGYERGQEQAKAATPTGLSLLDLDPAREALHQARAVADLLKMNTEPLDETTVSDSATLIVKQIDVAFAIIQR